MKLLEQYRKYLRKQGLSALSTRLYVSDARQYIKYLTKHHRLDLSKLEKAPEWYINSEKLSLFNQYLISRGMSSSTLTRMTSSLKRLQSYLAVKAKTSGEPVLSPTASAMMSTHKFARTISSLILNLDKLYQFEVRCR